MSEAPLYTALGSRVQDLVVEVNAGVVLAHIRERLRAILLPEFGFRFSGFELRILDTGFRVSGVRYRVDGFRFRESGFGFGVWDFRFRVSGFGFQASGFESRVSISGFGGPGLEFWGGKAPLGL